MTGPSPPGGGAGGPDESPLEDYLDRLLETAPGPPREVRGLLAEAEAHLRDATAEGISRGLTPAEAEREAVGRFGAARSVTVAEARRQRLPLGALARQVIASVLLLGAVGGVAVGVSGVIVAILGALRGSTFIVNISSRTHLAPSDCVRWLSQNPGAHSCYQAALSDWSSEVVAFRLVAGVLGLAALAAYFLVRRRWSRHSSFEALPASVVDTIAVTIFGMSGIWLLGAGIDWMVVGTNGAGQWLSAAPIALLLAGFYGFRLVGDIRRAHSGSRVAA